MATQYGSRAHGSRRPLTSLRPSRPRSAAPATRSEIRVSTPSSRWYASATNRCAQEGGSHGSIATRSDSRPRRSAHLDRAAGRRGRPIRVAGNAVERSADLTPESAVRGWQASRHPTSSSGSMASRLGCLVRRTPPTATCSTSTDPVASPRGCTTCPSSSAGWWSRGPVACWCPLRSPRALVPEGPGQLVGLEEPLERPPIAFSREAGRRAGVLRAVQFR